MHKPFSSPILVCALVLTAASQAQDLPIGRNVDTLLTFARSRSPEYTATRLDADAAGERIVSAAALPDPRLRVELRDITRSGEQAASVSPSRVGSTRYLLMQDLPWYGKRDLRREIAELEAETARGKASEAWADLAAKIKAVHAQRYLLKHSRQLSGEILDGMTRLQKIAQVRYAGGLGTQQDVLRAQIEQTGMKSEILLLEAESPVVGALERLAGPSSRR